MGSYRTSDGHTYTETPQSALKKAVIAGAVALTPTGVMVTVWLHHTGKIDVMPIVEFLKLFVTG